MNLRILEQDNTRYLPLVETTSWCLWFSRRHLLCLREEAVGKSLGTVIMGHKGLSLLVVSQVHNEHIPSVCCRVHCPAAQLRCSVPVTVDDLPAGSTLAQSKASRLVHTFTLPDDSAGIVLSLFCTSFRNDDCYSEAGETEQQEYTCCDLRCILTRSNVL